MISKLGSLTFSIFVLSVISTTLVRAEMTGSDKSRLDNKNWTEIGGYIFATDISGNVEIGPVETDLDVSFQDIFDNLDFGVMGYIEHRKNNWFFLADAAYMDLSIDDTIASNNVISVKLDAELTQLIFEGYLGYRVLEDELSPNSDVSVDLLVGARYNYISFDVGIEASGIGLSTKISRERSYNWVDPVIGARVRYNFLDNWGAMLIADIGGFGVGSEITWQVGAFLNYTFDNNVRLYGGARFLHFEYEEGSNVGDFKIEADYTGPMIGMAYRF